jgi:hypothetical protein
MQELRDFSDRITEQLLNCAGELTGCGLEGAQHAREQSSQVW